MYKTILSETLAPVIVLKNLCYGSPDSHPSNKKTCLSAALSCNLQTLGFNNVSLRFICYVYVCVLRRDNGSGVIVYLYSNQIGYEINVNKPKHIHIMYIYIRICTSNCFTVTTFHNSFRLFVILISKLRI